jgi:hypothetical protein
MAYIIINRYKQGVICKLSHVKLSVISRPLTQISISPGIIKLAVPNQSYRKIAGKTESIIITEIYALRIAFIEQPALTP